MGKILVKDDVFPEITRIYNTEGKKAAYAVLRDKYGVKHPFFVINRIKESKDYSYDQETDRFTGRTDKDSAESVFMDLDELCSPAVTTAARKEPPVRDSRPAAMEKLVHELISDRLLALSRYITLDSSSRVLYIDQTSLASDGYQIVTH